VAFKHLLWLVVLAFSSVFIDLDLVYFCQTPVFTGALRLQPGIRRCGVSGCSKRFDMSQHWPLSQTAGKFSGTFSVCLATRQLHLKDGKIHRHGSRDNPCPRSNKPPLDAGTQSNACLNQRMPIASSSDTPSENTIASPTVNDVWSPSAVHAIKHIPKSARAACASHLAVLLREVATHPEVLSSWISVFNWSAVILPPPKRGGKRHNLTNTIKNRVASFSGSSPQMSDKQTGRSASDSALLSQAVAAKLEDGNVRAAIRILNSEESPEPPSLASLSKLQEKHPPPLAWTQRSHYRHNFPALPWMRQKCGKQCCPFPRAHQEVQTACDLSTYATCFSVGNLAVTFCRPSRLLLIWCWLDVVHLNPRVFSLEADSWHLRKKNRRDPPHRCWFYPASPGIKVRQYLWCKSAIFIPQPEAAWCGRSWRM